MIQQANHNHVEARPQGRKALTFTCITRDRLIHRLNEEAEANIFGKEQRPTGSLRSFCRDLVMCTRRWIT